MIRAEIQWINRQRLEKWQRDLTKEHATAIIVLGIGQDHKCGEITLCALNEKEFDKPTLAAFLRSAVAILEGGAP